ncbi:MAG TPA: metal-sulfur cluster assembly factor [Mucilaginibacter sp.]
MKDIKITDPCYEEKARLLQLLSLVRDPELELNIVDLGLIYEIEIDKEKKLTEITMTLSTPACPAGDYIKGGVELMAKEACPGFEIRINLTFEPQWSADHISEAGRQELGW